GGAGDGDAGVGAGGAHGGSAWGGSRPPQGRFIRGAKSHHGGTPLSRSPTMTRVVNMARAAMHHGDPRAGMVARGIEEQSSKLPSDTFLWAALGSIGLSLTLRLSGRRDLSQFVGQWAPTFLILGLYNKLVKIEGHDYEDREE